MIAVPTSVVDARVKVSDWCLRFEAYGCNTQMDAAVVHATPITLVSLGDTARATGRLWALPSSAIRLFSRDGDN